MDFWNHKVYVSNEAAERQIAIISSFPPSKRMQIALDFGNLGVDQTRNWIKQNNPGFSELEITLAFVRLIYFETGQMSEKQWAFFNKAMKEKIRKDWSSRFRKMMAENGWNYEDVSKLGLLKNGKVVQATISRELPSFARLAVLIHENRSTITHKDIADL